MDDASLRSRIEDLGPWFHNLRLGGVETAPDHPLGDYPSFKWQGFAHLVPDDLGGASVLDIGCNAGFYAMEMARRGADRVIGIDSDPRYLAQARLAADVEGGGLKSRIEFRQLSVYQVAELGETFDFVIFMGVFYHLRHPLLALDLLWDHVVGDRMLFQSMQRGSEKVFETQADYPFSEWAELEREDFPRLYFIEKRYAQDPTNWFVPNRAAAEALLRSSGFRIDAQAEREVYLCTRTDRPEAVEPPPRMAREG